VRKKFTRDSKTRSSRLTDSKKPLGSKKGDSEKIAECESRLAFIHTRKQSLLDALRARRV
jgi:hypothetical protein